MAALSPCAVLQELDTTIFRLINQSWSAPALDPFITFFNGGALFKQLGFLIGLIVVWKGNNRARLCLLFMALVLTIGDWIIVSSIKKTVGRQRPYQQFQDVRHITGRGDAGSMPSGHAANITAAAIVMAFFYRRSKWIMIPVAFMVCFARVYSGVHFPSDVLAGALVAGIYSPAILYGVDWLWRKKASAIAPGWAERVPSLLDPPAVEQTEGTPLFSYNFWKLGWLVIAGVLALRLLYLAGNKIELSEDEAYQWLWSKHLALSYYSKPPLIAYTQFLGTKLWGDTQFGVRFFSPLLAALNAGILFAFLTRRINDRVAFYTVAAACAAPMLAAGATLMTIDALSVFSWTVAMVLTWRAVERDSTRDWILVGLAICFGLLAKYIALAQWVSIFLFLAMVPQAARQFRRPGLYLAMVISLLGLIPIIVWNQQHDWVTLTHLNERSGLDQAWRLTSRFIIDFVLAEFGLLNPVFFVLVVWAALKFWKGRTPEQTFLFCMGAPLFLGYFLYTFRARVQPNWIAPAILPLFALAAIYWDARWPSARNWLKPTVKIGFILGLTAVVLLHDTKLTDKVFGYKLPPKLDPLTRVRAWSTMAKQVEEERQKLPNAAFVIGAHYGITSLLTFYTAETRRAPVDNNRIYALATDRPVNQFYFWPNYLKRAGESALFVQREGSALPPELSKQFESVEDLGVREILYRDRLYHKIHLYFCHTLKPQAPSERR